MLTDQQKIRMKQVARSPYHPDLGKDNDKLEAVLSVIKIENPKSFLTSDELSERRFFHKPLSSIPFLTSEKDRL